MIKTNIQLVCDTCGAETVDIAESLDVPNPEYFAVGFCIHTAHEDDWEIDLLTQKCKCPNCKEK